MLLAAFWVRMTYGFIAEEIITPLVGAQSYVYLAFDAIIVALGMITMRHVHDFVWAFVFIISSWFITVLINEEGTMFYLNGLRDFISFLFVVPILRYFLNGKDSTRRNEFIEMMDSNLYWMLMVQIPCIFYQFFMYGAGDHGGGSLGNGNSGIISTFIYIVAFYLMNKRFDKQHYVKSLWRNKMLLLALVPTFFNETKISFIYFVLFFLLLIPLDKKAFMRTMIAIPLLVVAIWAGVLLYAATNGFSITEMLNLEYLYSDDEDLELYARWLFESGDEGFLEDLPRITKVALLPELWDEYNGAHDIYGFGVGHFKGGTVVADSEFYNANKWLLVGSVPYLYHIIIQLGYIGLALVIFYLGYVVGYKPIKGLKRDYAVQIYMVITWLMIFFYNDSLRFAHVVLPMFYICMLAYREDAAPKEISDPEIAVLS